MDDRELIARVLAGDPSAERVLYDAHVDRVFRMVYRIVGDPDQARDCVQDTFIRAFRRLADFRGESALGTWIGAIALSTALNALRKSKRQRQREVALDEAPEIGRPAGAGDPHLRARLHGAIEALPDGYRAVFLMHDVEGYTHEEIGSMLGIHAGTSKAQLFRARARLRRTLADFAPEQI
ncbi:MAG TPA: RNA polymerase sigma factor [Gemmatimonadales bacterium]|nr:RNA polymerase sigma factor [Gemmatimonadales bacterium]